MDRTDQIKIVNSWIKDLSHILDVELSLDEEGSCALQIGEDTIIGIEVAYDFPMVYLYAPLMALPADDKESAISMMSRALELNAFQAATRGGAIAVAPGGGLLIFCYSTPIEGVDSDMFGKILGSFYETLPELKTMLSGAPTYDNRLQKSLNTKGLSKGHWLKM